MDRLQSYIRPTSLTWWTGIILIFSGLFRVWGVEIPHLTPAIRPLIDILFGSSDPGALISAGLLAIGIRARLARGAE